MNFPGLLQYDVSHQFLMGYLDYYYRFKIITKRARIRFDERDWHGIQADSRTRITLYKDIVSQTTERINEVLGDSWATPDFWASVKEAYSDDIAHFNTRNIAETFYNSVYRHFHRVGANQELMYVSRTGNYREFQGMSSISHDFALGDGDLVRVAAEILRLFSFTSKWEDKARDARRIAAKWTAFRAELGPGAAGARLEVLTSLFFRNKIAYIVGRYTHGGVVHPFILPLLHTEGRGIFVDALLLESDQVTSIFSYHRSYFLADITVPSDMVDFLQTFMPTKAISELYNAIGFEKHGKTVFYRELCRHFRNTAPAAAQEENGTRPQVPSAVGMPGQGDKQQGDGAGEEQFITAPGHRRHGHVRVHHAPPPHGVQDHPR